MDDGRDVQLPGFGAYKVPSGRVSFVYQYKTADRQTRSIRLGTLGEMTIEQARSLAADFAYQRRRGQDPVATIRAAKAEEKASNDLVLATYAEAFLQRKIDAGKPLNKAQTNIFTRDIIGLLGTRRIDRMTVADVEDFASTLGKRGPSARRMGLVYLKTVLNDARRRGIISASPADAVETPKAGQRDRRLRDDEVKRFWEACSDIPDCRGDLLHAILRLLKRKEEVSRMEWEHLDLVKAEWTLPASMNKGRKHHLIKLPSQVVEIIARQQPDIALRTGLVFTLDSGRTPPQLGSQVKDLIDANLHRRLELANEADGTGRAVQHYTIHDLRTTGASRLQEAPMLVQPSVIDAILLHVVGSGVTKIYQRSSLVLEAGEALQAWNDWLDDLVGTPDIWPGGPTLPRMRNAEIIRRIPNVPPHRVRAQLTCAQIASIHQAASAFDEPSAKLATLACLIPCDAGALAAAPIELIDRDRSLLRVPTSDWGHAEVALGFHAAIAVHAAIDGRTSGPLICDHHGAAVTADRDLDDHVAELLMFAQPMIAFEWTFDLIRSGIRRTMEKSRVLEHPLSMRSAPNADRDSDIETWQRQVSDWWAGQLGLPPIRPFEYIYAIELAAQAAGICKVRAEPRR